MQRVLIDEVGPTVAIGRSSADAPEIDGRVTIATGSRGGRRKAAIAKADSPVLQPGQFVEVKILDADEHDLHGVLA